MLKKIEVVEDITADRVRLETKRQSGGSFGRGGFEVRYTIRVPSSAQVELQNTNGEVRVTGVTRGARMSTTNGQIDGRGLGGEVRATTTNGGVEIELASLTQPVHVSTTNGGVTVRIPSDSKADLQATCTNGGIDVSGLELDVEGERTRRRLSRPSERRRPAHRRLDDQRRDRDRGRVEASRSRQLLSLADARRQQRAHPARNATPPSGVTAPHQRVPVSVST